MAAATSSHTVRSFSTARSSPSPRPRTRLAVRSSSLSPPILTHLKNKSATPIPVLRHVADAMAEDMRAGLASDGGSNLKMILSYVDSLPAGYVFEQGNADKTRRTRADAFHVEETRSIHQVDHECTLNVDC